MKNQYVVHGGKRLNGKYTLPSAKNAILPIMAASILCDGVTTLHNCPAISDIDNMSSLLTNVGAVISRDEDVLTIDATKIGCIEMSKDVFSRFRSSIFMLGAMLSRCKVAKIYQSGGCAIGERAIDIHISALQALGVIVAESDDCTVFDGANMHAGEVYFHFPSVGATENIILASIFLHGKTTIYNAACEPEVTDLANYLNQCGAKIMGTGSSIITIYGVDVLKSIHYTPIPDRIMAATLMCAVAGAGGELVLQNCKVEHITPCIECLSRMGCKIDTYDTILKISSKQKLVSFGKIKTAPYPGFATDMQSLFLSLGALAIGESIIEENIFENRFKNIGEIIKCGAEIKKINNFVVIKGGSTLAPAKMVAHDLRGGAGLLVLALSIKGASIIKDIQHIERGYDAIDTVLNQLGAKIVKI